MYSPILILTVNYNQKQVTLELLKSLQRCLENFDTLIIDNGSKSEEKLNSKDYPTYKNIYVLNLDKNYGFTGGFNRGIEYFLNHKQYKYILIINNDTEVDKNFIKPLLNTAEKYKNKDFIIAPRILFYNYKGKKDIIWFGGGYYNKLTGATKHKNLYKTSYLEYTNISNDYLTGCTLFIPRHTLRKLGGFNNSFFAYSEDVDLSLRLKKIHGELIYEPKSVIWHKVSITAKKYSPLSFYLQIRNSFWTTRLNLERRYLLSQILYFLIIRQFIWIGIAIIKGKNLKLIPSIYSGLYDGITKKI
jgi:GT2 family glycosyltransferase